jgi:hypothetical protein
MHDGAVASSCTMLLCLLPGTYLPCNPSRKCACVSVLVVMLYAEFMPTVHSGLNHVYFS